MDSDWWKKVTIKPGITTLHNTCIYVHVHLFIRLVAVYPDSTQPAELPCGSVGKAPA